MKPITQSQLEAILLDVKGATPVTFTAITDARANKKTIEINPVTGEKDPNPYDKILKKTRVNGFTGYDYEAAVNRQRAREGSNTDFDAQARKHGERICPAMSETNGSRKLVVKVQSLLSTEYFGVHGNQMVPITEAEAKRFIRPPSGSKTQELEKEIDHKEYNISNIEEISLAGERYRLPRS